MKNILEFIENSAARYPDKLAVADENGSLTYSQLESFSRKIGAWILAEIKGVRSYSCAVGQETRECGGVHGSCLQR